MTGVVSVDELPSLESLHLSHASDIFPQNICLCQRRGALADSEPFGGYTNDNFLCLDTHLQREREGTEQNP